MEGSGARRVFLPCCQAHTQTRVCAPTHTLTRTHALSDAKTHKHTSCFCKDTDRKSLADGGGSVLRVCTGREDEGRELPHIHTCAQTRTHTRPSDKHIVRTAAAGSERIRPRSALNSRRCSLEESNVPTFSSLCSRHLSRSLAHSPSDLPRSFGEDERWDLCTQ